MTIKETNMNINHLVARNAMFVVNHSGGKDSQAMLAHVAQLVPVNQIIVIHAVLPGVEWTGTEEAVHASAKALGIADANVLIVRAAKTLLEMVEGRGFWPSPKYRQCTSDLKRNPIEKRIRQLCHERSNFLVVNCMGLRAAESSSRAKLQEWKLNDKNSKAGREWYDWLPIHHYELDEVWSTIERSGQTRHWAYDVGMTRLSCAFCIMSSKADLATAARHNPGLLAQYAAMERKIDQTFLMPVNGQRRFLDEIFTAA
jgi:DNA sulfur modification protein DndC